MSKDEERFIPGIGLGLPTYRYIEGRTQACISRLMLVPNLVQWFSQEDSYELASNRNKIVKRFMETKVPYLLFVDQDMTFSPNDVVQLIIAMEDNPDAGLCGGFYLRRSESMDPLVGLLEGYKKAGVAKTLEWLRENKGKVTEADLVPGGFMLIRREMFEVLPKPIFYTAYPDPEEPESIWSDDNVFCLDVKKAGYKVLAHLGVNVGHILDVVLEPEECFWPRLEGLLAQEDENE